MASQKTIGRRLFERIKQNIGLDKPGEQPLKLRSFRIALENNEFERAKRIAGSRQRSDVIQAIDAFLTMQSGGQPQQKGLFDWLGGLFGGGGGGGGGWTPPGGGGGGFQPPVISNPPPGGPGGGIIDMLPGGIRTILSNIGDVDELIHNPTVRNFLLALDPTEANSIMAYFGIEGDVSDLQQSPPTGDDDWGTPAPTPSPGGGGPLMGGGGGFQGALMMEILSDSMTSKNGKAIMQAITGGHLQDGVIQQPERVQYGDRGVHHVSPPGFRTIEVGGEKYAVFIPLARAFNMMPSDGQTELQRLDKLARKFQSARKDVKKLAPKVGLKTNNRKSGPKR